MNDRQCRLCFESDQVTPFLTPCNCRGTQAYIHTHCLALYLQHFPDGVCRVCRTPMGMTPPDDSPYCLATLAWMLALAHGSTLPWDPRGMYLVLVAGVLLYGLHSRGLALRFAVLGMLLSASAICVSVSTFLWILTAITATTTGMVLGLYVPGSYLLLGFAIVAFALYCAFLIAVALVRTEPTAAALLTCILGTVWYLLVRARPPLRNV